jgi:uncharacterized repeat protein (TIGR02543 family)
MKKTIAILMTILMLFTLFQGALRENGVKAQDQPIWPMFLYNAQHTGRCPYDTSNNNGTLKWRYQTGEWIWSSPAIASDGTIYIGSNDDYLYAINPDGTLKWRYQKGYSVSSPAISSDETIYVGSYDGYLYAINPNGTLKWRYKTGLQVFASPAIASDGTIYVGSLDYYLYAINPDGTLKWRYQTGYRIFSSPAIASDGTVYVGSEDGYLYAINPDGTLKWSYETGSGIDSSPAIASDGTIYIGSLDYYLYAINPDGTLKWRYQTGEVVMFSSPAIGSDGTVYVGSWDYYLYAINPDGTLKWKYPTGSPIDSSPAIASDGTIYIGSYDYYLYAINPDGTLKWRYQTGYNVESSPAIGSDGTVYVGSWDGYLYAIGNPPPVLDHFEFNTISNQIANTPFNITITAKDQYGNTYTGFNSSVALSVNKGTITPTTTANFVDGVLSNLSVTIPEANTGVTITATASGKTGTSNSFDVVNNSCTVTFHLNYPGATPEPYATVTTNYNTPLGSNMPANPTRTGYTFAGWNTQEDGSGTTFTSSTVVISNIDVYAKWTINTFTITASAGPNGSISPSGSVSVNYGENKTFTITPNTGYHIADVKVDGTSVLSNVVDNHDGTFSYTFTNVTANHTIDATFAINTFTITASAGPNGSISPSGSVSVNYGENKTFTITPNTGYHISDVKVDNVSQGAVFSYTFTNVTANHTIDATFAINTFTITASAGPNGSISPSGSVSVNYGENKTFTITPNTGYHISDVKVDNVSQGAVFSYTFTNVTANHTIDATFAINTFTITASAGPNGSISPSGSVSVNYGENKTFTITPNTGYHIADVKVDGTSVLSNVVDNHDGTFSYTFTNVTANHTIDATFAINTFTITASAGPGGTITPSGTVSATYGTSKTFTIKADSKFMIFKILVDGNPTSITNLFEMNYTFNNITSNHAISAEFVLIPDLTPPTLTLPTINGINLDTPNATLQINQNTLTFTVSATDESGIGRMVVKVNGVVQIDKNNLDPTIYLSEGTNTVEVIVYDTVGNYTSKSFKIISDTKPPVIDVTLPEAVSSPEITVKGTVIDTVTGVQSVTVNGNLVIPTLEGSFETKLTLSTGANTVIIEAVDKVGNKSTKSFTVSYVQPQAKQSYMVVLKVGNPTITVNGTSEKIDAQGSKPIIKDGRTLLPIRTLIESLGGTVEWNGKEQKATITLNGHSMVLWIGKTTALVDGSKATLDVAPLIINGRTYIPLRFVSEHLGGSVNWDDKTQTVTIYYWP